MVPAGAAAASGCVTSRLLPRTRPRVCLSPSPLPRLLLRQPRELALHRIELREVAAQVVLAAALARHGLEAAAREGVAGGAAAQVDDRGQVLLLRERRGDDAPPREGPRDAAVEEGRGHLDGV